MAIDSEVCLNIEHNYNLKLNRQEKLLRTACYFHKKTGLSRIKPVYIIIIFIENLIFVNNEALIVVVHVAIS